MTNISKYTGNYEMLENIENMEPKIAIKELVSEIRLLHEYDSNCRKAHAISAMQDEHQREIAEEHRRVLEMITSTQKCIGDTQKCMSENIAAFSNFVKKHEPNFELLETITSTLSGIKTAIGWLAAVVGSLGIIVGAVLLTWVYLTSGAPLESFILK